MLQLEGTKCSFLFCLGICVLICSAIYLKAKISSAPAAQQIFVSCRPFPQYCTALLTRGEETEWQRRDCLGEGYFLSSQLNCSRMVKELHFITSPLSREEEEYPLAFIITIHKELEMFARLFRAIYAPQNVYCIHVDDKSPLQYKTAVQRLAACFPNVFLSSVSEKVTYAGFSRLKADINCMRDLVKSPVRWKRVINLCGQDFPIKSNLELVRYMQSSKWRDRNMTPGIKQPSSMRYRTQTQHREIRGSHVAPRGKGHKKGPPPHKVQIYFGTAYYSLTRPFVDFVLQSQVARDLLEWSKDTYSPDEHYWVTLNHIKGYYIRDICIYGLEDLQWIIDKNSMFANKFETKTSPGALDCLEQWHRQKVLQQAEVPIQPEWQLAIETNKVPNASRGPS
ncbi:hypothetical protein MATL_G00079090 [Megalops atlanticus]|uniref:Glucosaminyl (N-acetyl) transferase family member 7 n=1 Tax=Megalops atlanticus TaxID=7932 RepID=A0A9D3Q7E9_MEGAT|nr:hypothetical protein MATL_G00079090 [Megalops atlanticus]